MMEDSWIEQRLFITKAITALGTHPLAERIRQSLHKLEPYVPNTSDYNKIPNFDGKKLQCGRYSIAFAATNGGGSLFITPQRKVSVLRFVFVLFIDSFSLSLFWKKGISYLYDNVTNRQWASPINALSQFVYTTFSENDFGTFLDQYAYCDWRTQCPWFIGVRTFSFQTSINTQTHSIHSI
jgi:hypothetical protein